MREMTGNRPMIGWMRRSTGFVLVCMTAGSLAAQTTTESQARWLPTQWACAPAGSTHPLAEFPLSLVLSPDRRFGAVVSCGVGPHAVQILGMERRQEVSSATLGNAWPAAAWSPDGQFLYVSRGADDTVARFPVTEGKLGIPATISLHLAPEANDAGSTDICRLPSGIALSADGKSLFVTEMYANRLLRVDVSSDSASGGGSGKVSVVCKFEGARAYPSAVVLHPSKPLAYVSLMGASAVAEVDLASGAVERIRTDPLPGAMTLTKDGRRLFVACSNSNSVNEIDTRWRTVSESLPTSLFPNSPPGSTPLGLGLSPDEVFLAVANADNNNIAIFDARRPGEAHPLGYIPTGWYPTAVEYGNDGTLVVVNAKGDGVPPPSGTAGSNPPGSAQFIDKLDAQSLWKHTQQVYPASPLRGDFAPVGAESLAAGNPIPRSLEERSPIYYLVYIVLGHRTYDEVLGDMAKGKGDPGLCRFNAQVTPNIHALADQFVLLENFYVESNSPITGAEWSVGAYANAYVERLRPSIQGGHGALPWPPDIHDSADDPPIGRIWDFTYNAGVNYRSYGIHMKGGGTSCNAEPLVRALENQSSPCYPAQGSGGSNARRADEFLEELHRYNTESVLPRLTILSLPAEERDGETSVTAAARQDEALGRIMEGLGKSRFWKAMAVFVVEQSANGPDSVHPQRSVALLASPWAKRGEVVSTRYSTSSVLRSIELILGLEPMTQFDAAARPLYDCFRSEPDLTPFRKP